MKLVNQDQSSILDIGGIPPFNKPQRRSCVSFNIVFYNYSSVMPENEEEIALISHSHFDRYALISASFLLYHFYTVSLLIVKTLFD